MEWYEVKTGKQAGALVEATMIAIRKLREVAMNEGLLSPIKLGDTPDRWADRHALYLLPNGRFEHRLSIRDSMKEEWVNVPSRTPDDEGLRELIARCHVTPQSVGALAMTLSLTNSQVVHPR